MIKKILLTLLAVTITGGGILYYYLEIKEYEIQDETVNKVLDEEYKIEKPEINLNKNSNEGNKIVEKSKDASNSENSLDKNTDNQDNEENNSASTQDNTNDTKENARQRDEDNQSSNKTKNTTSEDKEDNNSNNFEKEQDKSSNEQDEKQAISKQQLLSSYTAAFEELQNQANSKINQVLQRALSEYKTAKENGKDVSYMYFYKKYRSAEERLEKQTDNTFNQLYSSLQNDLKQYGYSTSEAKVYKEEYEDRKMERKKRIIKKAMDMF